MALRQYIGGGDDRQLRFRPGVGHAYTERMGGWQRGAGRVSATSLILDDVLQSVDASIRVQVMEASFI